MALVIHWTHSSRDSIVNPTVAEGTVANLDDTRVFQVSISPPTPQFIGIVQLNFSDLNASDIAKPLPTQEYTDWRLRLDFPGSPGALQIDISDGSANQDPYFFQATAASRKFVNAWLATEAVDPTSGVGRVEFALIEYSLRSGAGAINHRPVLVTSVVDQNIIGPIQLSALATDEDGDAITYLWTARIEGFDVGSFDDNSIVNPIYTPPKRSGEDRIIEVEVKATDINNTSDSKLITLTLTRSALRLEELGDQGLIFGESYSLMLTTPTGATGATTTVVEGLPSGLTFDQTTMEISGKPIATGIFKVKYSVSDSISLPVTVLFTMTVVAIPKTITYPWMFFDTGYFPTEAGIPKDFGLRGRYEGGIPSNTEFSVVIGSAKYDVTSIAVSNGYVNFQGANISNVGNLLVICFQEGKYSISVLEISRNQIRTRNTNIKRGNIGVAIVDAFNLQSIDTLVPSFFVEIDGISIDMSHILDDMNSTKGIHAIEAMNRLADIGEFKFQMRNEGGVWDQDGNLDIYSVNIIQRESVVEYGLLIPERRVLWTGIIEELKKPASAGENQDLIDVVARDKIKELAEIKFPVRSSINNWYYYTPSNVGSGKADKGDVVSPYGRTGSTSNERVALRTSFRLAFQNIVEHLGETQLSDLALWTESERRNFIGVDTQHQAKVLSFIKDMINSEYGLLWADRFNSIRSSGRILYNHRDDKNESNTVVFSDASLRSLDILGIGDQGYSQIKLQSNTYEEISRFRPNDTLHRGTFAVDDENVFSRSINSVLSDTLEPPYVIASGETNSLEIRFEQITRDSYKGIVKEGVTEVFQDLITYWKDYNDGQKFAGVVPMQVYNDGTNNDTEVNIELSEITGTSIGAAIASQNFTNGLRFGQTKSWDSGKITAKVYYDHSTLTIDFKNNSQRRVAVSRIIALGRMVKLVRVDDLNREFPEVKRDNQLKYLAKYVNTNRNGHGGVGNEANDIAGIIALQYNNRLRWPLSITVEAARSRVSLLSCIESEIGDYVIVDSRVNDLRVGAIVMSEDWTVEWPSLVKNMILMPVSYGLIEHRPSTIYLKNALAPGRVIASSIRRRNPNRNTLLWKPAPVSIGNVITGYLVQGKLRSNSGWTTLSRSPSLANSYDHKVSGSWHYRIAAMNTTGRGPFTAPFPNVDSSNSRPVAIASFPGDINGTEVFLDKTITLEATASMLFTDADGDPITISVSSSNTSIANITLVGMVLKIVAQGTSGTVTLSIVGSDGEESASINAVVKFIARPVAPPPPPPDQDPDPPPPAVDPCRGVGRPDRFSLVPELSAGPGAIDHGGRIDGDQRTVSTFGINPFSGSSQWRGNTPRRYEYRHGTLGSNYSRPISIGLPSGRRIVRITTNGNAWLAQVRAVGSCRTGSWSGGFHFAN